MENQFIHFQGWISLGAKILDLGGCYSPRKVKETFPTEKSLFQFITTSCKRETKQITGKIGEGTKAHKIYATYYKIPKVGNLIWNAHSYCGSQKWTIRGINTIHPLYDKTPINCKRCL